MNLDVEILRVEQYYVLKSDGIVQRSLFQQIRVLTKPSKTPSVESRLF